MDAFAPPIARALLASLASAALLAAPPAIAGERKPSPPDLAGRWAQIQEATDVTSIPLVGDVETVGTTLLLLDVEQEGTRLRIRETVCAIRLDTSAIDIQPKLSPDFAKGLSGTVREGRVVYDNDRWEYQQPRTVMVHGAKLDDPEEDPLPEEVDDPRLVDGDEDGHPGLTAEVRGLVNGTVRLVQRLWNDLQGIVRSEDHVEGLMTWGREQEIVDASNFLLRKQMPTHPHPDPARSHFSMRRVPDDTDCRTLRKQAKKLLSP
ncbi:MAG: hypothetical protein ACQEXJ_23505 [Myxococcota bacterium]